MSGLVIDSIVRVLHIDGQTAGTGFVVSGDGLIATCAHVVAGAGVGPGGSVQVLFPRHGEVRTAVVESAFWRAPDTDDVAVLRAVQGLPDGVVALPLGRSAGSSGRSFRTFGFPSAKPVDGMWGYGMIGDPLPNEPGRVQLRGASEITQGFSGAPVVEGAADRAVGMVSAVTRTDRLGRQAQTAFAVMVETLLRVCPVLRPLEECPYRSLSAFEEEHASYFFGRERDVQRLLDRLRREPRFLAVLGPSGSGKSSLLQAGLAARLRSGAAPGSHRWGIVSTRVSESGALSTQELVTYGPRLRTAIESWLGGHSDRTRCVLIVDQFEELFVTVRNEARAEFFAQLAEILDSDLPLSVIIAMRDDFYSRLARDARGLIEWVERGLVNIAPTLGPAALWDIVERPAEVVGLRFETGLADAIIGDTIGASTTSQEGEPGAPSTVLPLLEFALAQLWDRRVDGWLTHAAYRTIGGVTGGLTQWADQAYQCMGPDLRRLARRIFTDLVHLGEESQGIPDSRWRRPMAALCRTEAERAAVESTIRSLTAARLLVTSSRGTSESETVELIHDALLREWGTLSSWLQEDRRFLIWRQELEHRVRIWVATGPDRVEERDEGRLLRGRDLEFAASVLAEREADLSGVQQQFIRVSLDAQAQQVRRERELQAEADYQRQLAAQRATAVSLREKAARTLEVLTVNPVQGLMLAIETVGDNLRDLPGEVLGPVQSCLHTALRVAKERRVLGGHQACVRAVTFSPDGELIVSASDDRSLRLWDRYGEPIGEPLNGHEDFVAAVAFSPDGELIASGGGDRSLRLWSRRGKAVASWPSGHEDFVATVAFGPDGEVILSGGRDQTLRLWSLRGEAVASWPSGHENFVAAAAFSPDGQAIVSGGGDGTVRLFDRQGQQVHDPLRGHIAAVTALSFSRDAALIVSASADRTLRLWDWRETALLDSLDPAGRRVATTPAVRPAAQPSAHGGRQHAVHVWDRHGCQLLPAWRGHREYVWSVAVSPAGTVVASAGDDRTIRLWDLRGGELADPFEGHEAAVYSVAFHPDGDLLASGSGDRTVRLWSLRDGRACGRPLKGHSDLVASVAFSPDGSMIASGGSDGTVRLWLLADDTVRPALETTYESSIHAITFSRDGRLLASSGDDGTVRLWSLGAEQSLPPLLGHEGPVRAVAFDPSGRSVASAGDDGTVRLWPLDGDAVTEHRPFRGHAGMVRAVAFSLDGSMIVSGGADRTLRLWDRHGDLLARPLRGHDVEVTSLALRHDGQVIVSSGGDTTVRLWCGGTWRTWLRDACQRIQRHSSLSHDNSGAATACAICHDRPWEQNPVPVTHP